MASTETNMEIDPISALNEIEEKCQKFVDGNNDFNGKDVGVCLDNVSPDTEDNNVDSLDIACPVKDKEENICVDMHEKLEDANTTESDANGNVDPDSEDTASVKSNDIKGSTENEEHKDKQNEKEDDADNYSDIVAIDIERHKSKPENSSDKEEPDQEQGSGSAGRDEASADQDEETQNESIKDDSAMLDESANQSSDQMNETLDTSISDEVENADGEGPTSRHGLKLRKRRRWSREWASMSSYKKRKLNNIALKIAFSSAQKDSGDGADGVADVSINTDEKSPVHGHRAGRGRGRGKKKLFDRGLIAEPGKAEPLAPDVFELLSVPFRKGWRRELVIRGTMGEKLSPRKSMSTSDVYYMPPVGKKLRSMVQVQDWLAMNKSDLTPDNFSFMRRPLGVEEGEVVRHAAASRGRGTRIEQSPSEPRRGRKKSFKGLATPYDDAEDDSEFGKPEVVIERDTDEFPSSDVQSTSESSKAYPPVRFDTDASHGTPRRGRPRKNTHYEVMTITKKENIETIQPSNETVIVTPPKGLKMKFTARKSTTPKPSKQPIPYSGTESLCNLHCPGLEGMAPMLMCSKCMCLFHHECVNHFEDDAYFCCLRCKTDPSKLMHMRMPNMVSNPNHPSAYSLSNNAASASPTSLSSNHSSSLPGLSKYPDIKPLIKQEPRDNSYDGAKITGTQASSEALGSLKSVLQSRSSLSSSNSPFSSQPMDHNRLYTAPHKVSSPSIAMQADRLAGNRMSPAVSPATTLNLLNSPQLQLGRNSNFRLIPVGPPVSLPNVPFQPIRLPGMTVQSLMPLRTVPPPIQAISSPKAATQALHDLQKSSLVSKATVSQTLNCLSNLVAMVDAKDKQDTSVKDGFSPTTQASQKGGSGRLVIDGTTIGAPESGQLLTLPGAISKKLTLSKPLVLKIKNRQISVPPSGFFQASDGLKIFLPPNTFPTAEEELENAEKDENNKKDSSVTEVADKNKSSSNAKVNEGTKDIKTAVQSDTKAVQDVVSHGVSSVGITKSRRYSKCCLIQRLYGGYDCMYNVFRFLSIKELLQVGQVCRTWRMISLHPYLWNLASFRDIKVISWSTAIQVLKQRGVSSISLLGMVPCEDMERTWNGFILSVCEVPSLKHLVFGLVPPPVLEAVCLRLTNLQSLCAQYVSSQGASQIGSGPIELDMGKLGCLMELRELKVKGVSGLTLPAMSLCGGLGNLAKLQHLQALCLTSLKNVAGANFGFISELKNLKELALGECKGWTAETFSALGRVSGLQQLRLEHGGDMQDLGLGVALTNLHYLHTLQLHTWVIPDSFKDHLQQLSQLRTLMLWPDNSSQPAEVNSYTLAAVSSLSTLGSLKWVILNRQNGGIMLDDNGNTDNVSGGQQEWVPFLSSTDQDQEAGSARKTEYVAISKLTENLAKLLPETRINVYSLQPDQDEQNGCS